MPYPERAPQPQPQPAHSTAVQPQPQYGQYAQQPTYAPNYVPQQQNNLNSQTQVTVSMIAPIAAVSQVPMILPSRP